MIDLKNFHSIISYALAHVKFKGHEFVITLTSGFHVVQSFIGNDEIISDEATRNKYTLSVGHMIKGIIDLSLSARTFATIL